MFQPHITLRVPYPYRLTRLHLNRAASHQGCLRKQHWIWGVGDGWGWSSFSSWTTSAFLQPPLVIWCFYQFSVKQDPANVLLSEPSFISFHLWTYTCQLPTSKASITEAFSVAVRPKESTFQLSSQVGWLVPESSSLKGTKGVMYPHPWGKPTRILPSSSFSQKWVYLQ